MAQIVRDEKGSYSVLDFNLEDGIVTANNFVKYSASFVERHIKSRMQLLVKDGRFKIRHDNIESNVTDGQYVRQGKWWGTAWEDAEKSLIEISEKVANCIQSKNQNDDW
jgi:hypothetical protein